jgi:hypothetical protein
MGTPKRTASFYQAAKRPNEETLAEAHALAALAGHKLAAAALHQLIAAMLPESGYAIMVYPCRYAQHYSGAGYERRRLPGRHATGLNPELLRMSEIAVRDQEGIETLHNACFPDYASMDQNQREAAVQKFRNGLQHRYPDQNPARP